MGGNEQQQNASDVKEESIGAYLNLDDVEGFQYMRELPAKKHTDIKILLGGVTKEFTLEEFKKLVSPTF